MRCHTMNKGPEVRYLPVEIHRAVNGIVIPARLSTAARTGDTFFMLEEQGKVKALLTNSQQR